MTYEHPFACMTVDHGPASELVHVSPIFTRYAPSRRGQYADRRLTRSRRTDARRVRRHHTESQFIECLGDPVAEMANLILRQSRHGGADVNSRF